MHLLDVLCARVSEEGSEATEKYENRKNEELTYSMPFLFQSTVPAGKLSLSLAPSATFLFEVYICSDQWYHVS